MQATYRGEVLRRLTSFILDVLFFVVAGFSDCPERRQTGWLKIIKDYLNVFFSVSTLVGMFLCYLLSEHNVRF